MEFLSFLCTVWREYTFFNVLVHNLLVLGIPVPVACLLTGTAIADNGDPVPVDETIDFMNFFEVRIKQWILEQERVSKENEKRLSS